MLSTGSRALRFFFMGLAAMGLSALLAGCGGGDDEAVLVLADGSTLPAQVCQTTSRHADGDTFDCTTSAQTFTVRLSAVDAPESNQSYAEASRQALAALTPAGTLVACYKTDTYNRRICRVFTPGQRDVQALLLEAGMAWHYTRFSAEQFDFEVEDYANLTRYAQLQRLGLWSQEDPQAPWDCRTSRVCR